jgi:predicted transglutaminase-like cysteine proteinase
VLHAEEQNPCLQLEMSCLAGADASRWLELVDKAPQLDEMALLHAVNAFFNSFPYVADAENYGVEDRWPSMADFSSRRAGDCKAKALAKYFALRTLGVDDDRMRIVLAYMPKRKLDHAMLAVASSRGVVILDNIARPSGMLLPPETLGAEYVPLFKFNETGRWTFRQDRNQARVKNTGKPKG